MASNLRVLVSNIDGNWGHYDYGSGAVTTANNLVGTSTVYFPPGTGAAAPTESQMFFSTDYAGWTSKSNWMIQIAGTFGGQTVSVFVGRPSGVEEEIIKEADANLTWGGGSSIDFSGGGTAVEVYENIVGPVTYFKFVANGAVTRVKCYVTAWNEGDICDAVGRLS